MITQTVCSVSPTVQTSSLSAGTQPLARLKVYLCFLPDFAEKMSPRSHVLWIKLDKIWKDIFTYVECPFKGKVHLRVKRVFLLLRSIYPSGVSRCGFLRHRLILSNKWNKMSLCFWDLKTCCGDLLMQAHWEIKLEIWRHTNNSGEAGEQVR